MNHAMVAWVDIGLLAMGIFAAVGLGYIFYLLVKLAEDQDWEGVLALALTIVWIFWLVTIVGIIQGAWVTS